MYGKVQVIMWRHVLYHLIYIYHSPNWLWFFLDLKYPNCFTDCAWGMFHRGPCLEHGASGWKTLCSSELAVNASAPGHAGDWPACPLLAPWRCLHSLPLSLCLNPDSSFNTLLKSHLWIMDDCSWKWLLLPPTPRRSYCRPWGWPTADPW